MAEEEPCEESPKRMESHFLQNKQIQIVEALERNDKLALKTYSITNGGFVSNELRTQVWFRLVLNGDHLSVPSHLPPFAANPFHRQVILDVERSLKRFPPSVKEEKRILYQDSLIHMIVQILNCNPSFHYYQGYHDICLTFLLIMDEKRAFMLVNQLSRSHLRYFMERTMHTTSNMLEIIYLILYDENRELHDHMIKSEVGTIFSLSWVITWFSHVLPDLQSIIRLFDFFISSHFLMPIYLTVSILLYKSEEILTIDCDMASMHKYLTNIPEHEELPFDTLVEDSLLLSEKYPPEDTLSKQQEMQTMALEDKESPVKVLLDNSCKFLKRNIFSITFIGLFTALAYQFYSDHS